MMIAAKSFDPVLGVDVHIIQPPGPVPPVPVPHPFVGMLVDPMDFAPIIGATVFIGGMPRATAGTGGKCIPPHIPIGGVFVKPPANECEVFMGSSTVLADGDPLSRLGEPALSCSDIGIVAPPRPTKKRTTKSLVLPTSVVLPIPSGPPVIVGGPPTISMKALAIRAGKALLGRALRRLRRAMRASRRMRAASARVQRAAARGMDRLRVPASVRNRVHRAICTVTGHPVDVATGKVFAEAIDLTLPGLFPIVWERVWFSTSVYPGPLGHGWHSPYDAALVETDGAVAVRLPDGRPLAFTALPPGEAMADEAGEGTVLFRDREGYGLHDRDGRILRFRISERTGIHDLASVSWVGRTHRIERDGAGGLLSIRDDEGHALTFVRDDAGRIREIRGARPDGGEGEAVLLRYRYDGAGNLVAAEDAAGAATRYEYAGHLLVRETDRRGYAFSFQWDGSGPEACCLRTRGEDGLHDVHLRYEEGRTVTRLQDGGEWVYEHEGGVVFAITDPYGVRRPYREPESPLDPPPVEDGSSPRVPEPMGNPPHDSSARWECGGLVAPSTGWGPDLQILARLPERLAARVREEVVERRSADRAPEERRDPLGRVIEARHPDGTSEEWRHDPEGNVLFHRDRDGAVLHGRHASWNLLEAIGDGERRVVRFAHTLFGELEGVIDEAGNEVRLRRDLKDRPVEYLLRGEPFEEYRYTVDDALVEILDGEGAPRVRIEVDEGGNEIGWTTEEGEVRFAYDGEGRLVQAATEEMACDFERDEHGRWTADLRDGEGVTHRWSEEDAGGIETILGREVIRRGDPDDPELWEVVDPTGAVHRFRQGWEGEVLAEYADGARELLRYDGWGRCVAKDRWREGAPEEVWSRRYRYSPAGDLVERRDGPRGEEVHRFEYDRSHRLRAHIPEGDPARTQPYEQDASGNLIRGAGLGGVVIGPGNRILLAGEERFAHDARGRISERSGPAGTLRYRYDAFDRLVEVLRHVAEDHVEGHAGAEPRPSRRWRMLHDPLGRRTEREGPEGIRRFWWDEDRLVAEEREDGRLRIYIHIDRTALVPFLFVEYPNRDAAPEEGRRHYLATDHLGIPLRVEDEGGSILWEGAPAPYGSVEPTVERIEMPLRAPGHYADPGTGLHQNRFRDYDPRLGRFLQLDPSGPAGGLNLYAYTPNPLSEVDLDGLAKKSCGSKPGSGGSGGKPRAPRPRLQAGDRGRYGSLRGKTGGGLLDRDHIPSKAALLRRAEHLNGGPLTPAQRSRIVNGGETVAVPKSVHRAGPTYGGKNTASQVNSDANDLAGATKRDTDSLLQNAEDHYGAGNVPSGIEDAASDMASKTNADYDDWLGDMLDDP